MNVIAIVAGIILACIAGIMALGYATFFRQPMNNPKAFLQRGRLPKTKALVVCVGDSITHATVSADYVETLRQQLGEKNYEFVNAGHNNDMTAHVLKRLDTVIECQPDFVTVLIGTNDAYPVAHAKEYEENGLSEPEHIAIFQKNLSAIVEQLQANTQAKIALLSMPMQGQDLNSGANRVVSKFNEVIAQVCTAFNAEYLPLYEELSELVALNLSLKVAKKTANTSRIYLTPILHYAFGRSWDSLAADNGFIVLTDGIHLSKRGTSAIIKLIEQWLVSNQVN